MRGWSRRSLRWLSAAVLLALVLSGAPGAEADDERGAWLGVLLEDAVDGGVELVAIVPDGPAFRAGLRPGDVILSAAETQVGTVADLTRLLVGRGPGERLSFEVLRQGRTEERVVLLSVRSQPSAPLARPPRRAPVPPAAVAPPSFRRSLDRVGLRLADVTPDLRIHFGAPSDAGLLVTDVLSGRPAETAGVQVGDVLVRLGDERLEELTQAERFLLSVQPTDRAVDAWVVRGREPTKLVLRLATGSRAPPPRPDAARAADGEDRVERAILAEVERLERRIEELRRELAALRAKP